MVGVGVLIPDISIHALREEGDSLLLRCLCVRPADFYPRPPRGGRPLTDSISVPIEISIHALREEGDQAPRREACGHPDFYPRPPRGGRRTISSQAQNAGRNFYPRPPRGGRQDGKFFTCGWIPFLSTPSARRATYASGRSKRPTMISIHALREEGDVFPKGVIHPMSKISIHALREEGDGLALEYGTIITHFYPRPPRGGRPGIRFGCS